MAHPFIPVPEMTLGAIMTNFCFRGPENYTFYPMFVRCPIGPSEKLSNSYKIGSKMLKLHLFIPIFKRKKPCIFRL